jgi:cell pole-organizing protein PopZ
MSCSMQACWREVSAEAMAEIAGRIAADHERKAQHRQQRAVAVHRQAFKTPAVHPVAPVPLHGGATATHHHCKNAARPDVRQHHGR